MLTHEHRANYLAYQAKNDSYRLLDAIDALVSHIDVDAHSEVSDALDTLAELNIIEDPRATKYRIKGQMVVTYEITLTSREDEDEVSEDLQQHIYDALESGCDLLYKGDEEPDELFIVQWDVLANSHSID